VEVQRAAPVVLEKLPEIERAAVAKKDPHESLVSPVQRLEGDSSGKGFH
jgi:hypothetical protein